MLTVELVYFNAGGGHRAAAEALAAMAALEHRPWRVRLTHLFEVLDPKQRFQAWTGMAPEAYYNARLARGWTMGLERELKLLQSGIRWAHPLLVQRLQLHWANSEPDLVVSLVPNFNRAIGESLSRAVPGVPFMTVLTDLADFPPRFWIEPSVQAHVVCGTQQAADQAVDNGCDAARVYRVSGMMLRPAFYDFPALDRAQSRQELGIDPSALTGIVMFGGHGSAEMLRVARLLPDTPLILLCGHNERLARRLRAIPSRAPRVIVGFTSDIQRWMRLGDFFVGKPGPGSISEALQCGLPVVVTRNRRTMPQERFNTDWIAQQGLGLVIQQYSQLPAAVLQLSSQRSALQERVKAQRNNATREVTQLMARLLEQAQHQQGEPRRVAAVAEAPHCVTSLT
jgi:UDP-N-acetylglucosamine:LPS N-acetylglucosamine transferase